MATTNFQTWDAPNVNIQNDTEYINDASRQNGLPTGAIVPSPLLNKALKQGTIFPAAFGEMMAGKGYTTSDADQGALAAVLTNVLTQADLKPNMVTVPYSPSMVFDGSQGNGFNVNSVPAAVTSASFINGTVGQIYTFRVFNPNSMPWVWPSNFVGAYTPNGAVEDGTSIQQFLFMSDGNAYSITSMLDAVVAGKQNSLGFTPVQQGGGAGQGTNKVFLGWDGGGLKAQVDNSDLGRLVFGDSAQSGNGWFSIAGVIVQWATGFPQATGNNVQQTINFPRSFPSNCWAVLTSSSSSNASDGKPQSYTVIASNLSSVTVQQLRGDGQGSITTTPTILAIGN